MLDDKCGKHHIHRSIRQGEPAIGATSGVTFAKPRLAAFRQRESVRVGHHQVRIRMKPRPPRTGIRIAPAAVHHQPRRVRQESQIILVLDQFTPHILRQIRIHGVVLKPIPGLPGPGLQHALALPPAGTRRRRIPGHGDGRDTAGRPAQLPRPAAKSSARIPSSEGPWSILDSFGKQSLSKSAFIETVVSCNFVKNLTSPKYVNTRMFDCNWHLAWPMILLEA